MTQTQQTQTTAADDAARIRVTRDGRVLRDGKELGTVHRYQDAREWFALEQDQYGRGGDLPGPFKTRTAAVDYLTRAADMDQHLEELTRAENAAENAQSHARLASFAAVAHARRLENGVPVSTPETTFTATERDACHAADRAGTIAQQLTDAGAAAWIIRRAEAARDIAWGAWHSISVQWDAARAAREAAGYIGTDPAAVAAVDASTGDALEAGAAFGDAYEAARAARTAENTHDASAAADYGRRAADVVTSLRGGTSMADTAEKLAGRATDAAALATDAPFTCSVCGVRYGGYWEGTCGDCDPAAARFRDDDDAPAPGWDAL